MRVEPWRCSVKEAKSSGGTTCGLAFAAILDKNRNEDSLTAEKIQRGDPAGLKRDVGGRIGMPGAWAVERLVKLTLGGALEKGATQKKFMYLLKPCSRRSLIGLVTIIIQGEY
jgi:hypothetical protein